MSVPRREGRPELGASGSLDSRGGGVRKPGAGRGTVGSLVGLRRREGRGRSVARPKGGGLKSRRVLGSAVCWRRRGDMRVRGRPPSRVVHSPRSWRD
jgi:hypothetical protein